MNFRSRSFGGARQIFGNHRVHDGQDASLAEAALAKAVLRHELLNTRPDGTHVAQIGYNLFVERFAECQRIVNCVTHFSCPLAGLPPIFKRESIFHSIGTRRSRTSWQTVSDAAKPQT